MKAACRGADFAYEKEIQFDSDGGSRLITPEADLNAWISSLKK